MRNFQIDDGIFTNFDDASRSGSQAQVGLLIGRLGLGSRDFMLLHIPTPPVEGETEAVTVQGDQLHLPTKKAGQKTKGSAAPGVRIEINDDWVAEHATQVAPLLPGGLAVVGLYLFAPDAAFAAGNAQLCRALASMREASPDTGAKDLFLLDVCSATRKTTLREFPASATNASSLKACECKPAPVLANMAMITTRDTFKTAVAALKADLQRSLRARMAVLVTDAEDVAQSGDAKSELLQAGADLYQSAFRLPMPQRALLPSKGPICFSDYPLEEEADAAGISTAQDLLALKLVEANEIDWPEGAASTKEAPSLWRPLCKKTAARNSPVSYQKVSSTVECNSFMIGAVLFGGLAIAAGLGYMVT
ncbi:hypothetical protein WJX75_003266 [Coccomyxa subellipsoidea]|uniref:Protein odr-4 homolog n=1 Tax=Coccomyxa subellipsoidea TaxID=248742 RepID=A0ABR2YXI4_9CHLO